jgi:hypothetical protein
VTLLMVVALTMLAAPVYTLLGEKGISVSRALWNIAAALCRAVTGLFGLLAVVSVVTGRRSGSSRDDIFGSIAAGVVLIGAAIAGLRLVIVITGLGGLALLFAGGHMAVAAVRSRPPWPLRKRSRCKTPRVMLRGDANVSALDVIARTAELAR